MKYLKVDLLFFAIIALLSTMLDIIFFIVANFFYALWNLKFMSWYDFKLVPFDSYSYLKRGYPIYDMNPIDSFKRKYNILKAFINRKKEDDC